MEIDNGGAGAFSSFGDENVGGNTKPGGGGKENFLLNILWSFPSIYQFRRRSHLGRSVMEKFEHFFPHGLTIGFRSGIIALQPGKGIVALVRQLHDDRKESPNVAFSDRQIGVLPCGAR